MIKKNRLLALKTTIFSLLFFSGSYAVADNCLNESRFGSVIIGESSKDFVTKQFGLDIWYDETIYEKSCVISGDREFEFKFYKESDFDILLSVRQKMVSLNRVHKCVEVKESLSLGANFLDVGVGYDELFTKLEFFGFKKMALGDRVLFKKVFDIEYDDIPNIFKESIGEDEQYTYHQSVKYYIGLSGDKNVTSIEKEIAYYDDPI